MNNITSSIWQKRGLTPHQKFVLLAIADDPLCTVKIIYEKTGLSERWVRQCIKELINLRLIRMQNNNNIHTYAPNAELNKRTLDLSAEHIALCAYPKSAAHRTQARVVDNNTYSTSGSGKVLGTNSSDNNILIFKNSNVHSSNTHENHSKMETRSMQQRIAQDEEKYKSLSPSERETNLYRLLFAFKRHVSPGLCITMVDDRRSPYREAGGRLTHELEELWRNTLRRYMIDYQIKYEDLLKRVERLGRYVGQRKPIQLRDRKMSFLEFLTSKHRYFEKWMAVAITDPSCEEVNDTRPSITQIKTSISQEEYISGMEAISNLKKTLGIPLELQIALEKTLGVPLELQIA